MLFTIPFTSLVALVSCASILGAPEAVQDSSRYTLSRREVNPPNQNGMKNLTPGGANSAKSGGSPAQLTEAQKEAQEEAEENKPGLNTIANTMNELYFYNKFGGQRKEPTTLLKTVGLAVSNSCKSGDPEAVSKAMLATFGPYNQGKPSSVSASPITPLNKNTASMEETPSLKTVAHTLHETWEKLMTMSPKPENAQMIPVFCQAIAASSTGGDAVAVSKAIESAYAKIAGKQESPSN